MKPSRRVTLIAAAVVVVGLLFWFRDSLDLEKLHAWAEGMNGGLVFLALTVLPLVGFPVSVLHAVAGARFGLPLGMALVALSIALQLVASYGIVRAAPGFFARRFEWLRRRLPPATHRSLTLFTMLLPAVPYFAQNYVLPVVGVPFGIYFVYSLLIHFVRSFSGVIFGEWSGDMTPARMVVFGLYLTGITVACALAFRRLRAQLQSQRPAGNGRKRRGSDGPAARRSSPARTRQR